MKPEIIDKTDREKWEVIATVSGMTEANLIAGRLASDGIRTRFNYEAAGAIYAITVDGLGEVKILVPSSDREKAREILARAYSDGELPWERDP